MKPAISIRSRRIIPRPKIDGQRTFIRRRRFFSIRPIIRWYAVVNPKTLARERKIGPAYEETTEMGPLVNAEHFAFVNGWIEK